LLLAAVIDLKRITIPVFLIYAGIIHAIGLALLLPMIVTLPGPGSMITPKDTPIAVELDPAAANRDMTSALSPPPKLSEKDAAIGPAPDAAADAPGNIANLLPPSTEAEPEAAAREAKPVVAAPKPREKAASTGAKPAKSVKKPVAQRSGKPSVRRSARKDTKIAPFGGGMSGLFTPGAPSKRR
jgi:hypothetical protein